MMIMMIMKIMKIKIVLILMLLLFQAFIIIQVLVEHIITPNILNNMVEIGVILRKI